MVEITAVARNADVQVDSIIVHNKNLQLCPAMLLYQMNFSGAYACFHFELRSNLSNHSRKLALNNKIDGMWFPRVNENETIPYIYQHTLRGSQAISSSANVHMINTTRRFCDKCLRVVQKKKSKKKESPFVYDYQTIALRKTSQLTA